MEEKKAMLHTSKTQVSGIWYITNKYPHIGPFLQWGLYSKPVKYEKWMEHYPYKNCPRGFETETWFWL